MQSFFGNAKPQRPTFSSTVTKKVVPSPRVPLPSSSKPHAHDSRDARDRDRDRDRDTHSRPKPTHRDAQSSQSHHSKPGPGTRPNGSTPLGSAPGSSSRTTTHFSNLDKNPRPSSSSPAIRRKKAASYQRVLPPSDSESSSSEDAFTPKKRKVNGHSTVGANGNANANGAGAGAGSRGERRGAGSSTPDVLGDSDMDPERLFCPGLVDERGEFGRGWAGFVPCEEAVRGVLAGWGGGGVGGTKEREREGAAREGRDKYQAYFPQPGFENAEPLPSVELHYPSGASEKFILLTPLSSREYNPVSELRDTLRMILRHYIPPSHAHIFGTLDGSLDNPEVHSSVPSRVQSPAPGTLATPPPDLRSPTPQTHHDTIGDALRRALAPNRRDGPGLVRAMARFNAALDDLRRDGSLAAYLTSPEYRITKREWSDLVEHVHDQTYSRVVAPFSDLLEHHPKHPDDVAEAISEKEDAYGELRHAFMAKIIDQTSLGPGKVFVDLGSGVGNCVLQAALQAGCRSYGFELLPIPSRCARLQVLECSRRWALWCLAGEKDISVSQGDFRRLPSVATRLSEADVVLVNNEVFPSSLNMDLSHLFLDLKDGAAIVSLKPFVPDGFRMNGSNCDSFAAILRSTPHAYHSGWVSWKADSGRYYVQIVDRSRRLKYEEEMSGRARRG